MAVHWERDVGGTILLSWQESRLLGLGELAWLLHRHGAWGLGRHSVLSCLVSGPNFLTDTPIISRGWYFVSMSWPYASYWPRFVAI